MTSSDEDEDLKKAIQLSMQGTANVGEEDARREVINLDSGDETTTDDKADGKATKGELKNGLGEALASGMLGLDRKAMEQERLARRKRKASISPPPLRKSVKIEDTERESLVSTARDDTGLAAKSSHQTFNLPYINGVVKKTWAFGHPRDNDIKLEEVLQKNDLSLAVLSSFQWDVEWLLRKINTKNTQLVFVMQADTDEVKAQYRRETAAMTNLRLCFPSMEGQINCMHSKLMLLSYPTHLRVVVPTANLVPYDWGETGIMENTVFLIDLPRLPPDKEIPENEMTDFGKDLIYFLHAKGLDQTIVNSLYRFDFLATQDLAFVHTVGGAHFGANERWRRTGYCGLGRAITRLGLSSSTPLEIDYVTSSVGSLNIDFLTTLHLAAKGDDGLTEYNWRNQQVSKRHKDYQRIQANSQASQQTAKDETSKGFRIYFPTEHTVKASTGGPRNGGTICFQPKWWNAPTFPRNLLRDCRSRRRGLLMHNKVCHTNQANRHLDSELTNVCDWFRYSTSVQPPQTPNKSMMPHYYNRKRGHTWAQRIAQKVRGEGWSKIGKRSNRN